MPDSQKDCDESGLLIRQYPEGVKIFEEGDNAEEAYFIKEGRVRVYKKQEDGKRYELGIARQGDIIGEMSLLLNKQRTSTATALEKTNLVVIDKDLLSEKMQSADPLLSSMINMLIKRLYNAQEPE